MNPTTYAVAPDPPAGPGERWSSLDMQRYLQEMGRWRGRRERELRVLDEFAATAGAQEETTEDKNKRFPGDPRLIDFDQDVPF